MSNKATIVDLAKTLSNNTASTTTMNTFYDEVCRDLGRLPNPPLMDTTTLSITSGTARYTYPTNAIRILGVFHKSRQLSFLTTPEIESYTREWRGSTSTATLGVYLGEETARSIRLYPTPAENTTGAWLYSATPDPIPNWLDLYVTFSVLSREFSYPSNHQDKTTADIYANLATLTAKLLGLT